MDQNTRQQLLARLNALDSNERSKLYKKASQLRKNEQARSKSAPKRKRSSFDEDYNEIETVQKRAATLDDFLLKILQEEVQDARLEEFAGAKGMVLSVSKARCEVLYEGEVLNCLLTPELAQYQQTDLAVGDEVVVQGNVVQRVLKRRTKLSRPDPGAQIERVIVANVDLVVQVVSVVSPPLHPRVIDRYLIAIQRGGAEAAIVVNKLDLATDRSELELLEPYRAIGIPIIHCSAHGSSGIDELEALLDGKLSAFVGHSGVGKSSLMNAIKPDLSLKVGEVSATYGRGTHTTTSSTMWQLSPTTRVIDTPGIRSFGLWQIDKDELHWYFPEFSTVRCRFRDCHHVAEPGCAVIEAVEEGAISPFRYETYLRLREYYSGK